ncbi:MAG: hypothetical protein BWK79_11770 [Beggiatoa sp. IS2]|nr:MAG: hypothetical protein BWK79_11770 [Beggiatoa sp. IS2]
MRKVTLIIQSKLDNVALVGTAIQGLCVLTPLSLPAIDDVQLCVVESVNNVIEHSYANQENDLVEIVVNLYSDGLVIEIKDTGVAMDTSLLKFVTSPDITRKLPEGGWGLYIIKSRMDEVTYQTCDQTNILRLVKRFT